MGNKRNVAIDIAKGIGILLVIIGHVSIPSWSKDAIFSFHMPLFFILSGYFYRSGKQLIRVKKDARRLLLPYVVTMAVITLYMLAVHQGIKHDGWYYIVNTLWFWIYPTGAPGGLDFSGPVWFLLALFWTKSTFNLIEKVHNRWFYLILAFVALAPFCLYYRIGGDLPLAISQGLISIVFYWGGYEWKKHELSFGCSKPQKMMLICMALWPIGVMCSDLDVMRMIYHNYPICVLTAFAGTYIVIEASNSISKCKKVVFRRLSSFLSWGGRNSMTILCAHTLFWFTPVMVPFERIDSTFALCMQIIFCCLTAWICGKIKLTRSIFGIK